MSTFDIFCVTDRRRSVRAFEEQLERIAASGVSGIILREKDLTEEAYEALVRKVQGVCGPLILHTHTETARKLGIRKIHLPYQRFLSLKEADRAWFARIGVSVHTEEEAVRACRMGASYVTAGHIFATDCKKGVPPKGIGFLETVCRSAGIPVYAIGGISPEHAGLCIKAGAGGVCLMSALMKAQDPAAYVRELRSAAEYAAHGGAERADTGAATGG